MPYINKQDREFLDSGNCDPLSPGELNYSITKILTKYLHDNDLNYNTINDIIGALECAKQEFYRRIVIPYEDIKIKSNGDVY